MGVILGYLNDKHRNPSYAIFKLNHNHQEHNDHNGVINSSHKHTVLYSLHQQIKRIFNIIAQDQFPAIEKFHLQQSRLSSDGNCSLKSNMVSNKRNRRKLITYVSPIKRRNRPQ